MDKDKIQNRLIITVSKNKDLHIKSLELIENRDKNIHFNQNDYIFDCIRFYEEFKNKVNNINTSPVEDMKNQLKEELKKELKTEIDDKLNYFIKGFNAVVPIQHIQPLQQQEKAIDTVAPKKKNRISID